MPTEAGQTNKRGQGRGVLFVMPAHSAGEWGPVAVWITAANWARAARKLWGNAWIMTPEGTFGPENALYRASRPALAPRQRGRWRRHVPEALVTAVKDVRELRRARDFRRSALDHIAEIGDPAFVWQHHEIFHDAGFEVARALRRPLVQFVDAPQTWEDRKWGVRRPGWGRLVERRGERPQLMAADVVACVSDEVAVQISAMGVPPDRIVVTPTGVDPERFGPHISGDAVRQRHGLQGKFVVGWAGSFRPFHALPTGLEVIRRLQDSIPDLAFLLVGDGQERPRIKELANAMGLRNVVFTGTVPHDRVGEHLAAMDVALLLDQGTVDYHYSPLKLREYMAAGKPVVAARVGEVGRSVADEREALLVEPGDAAGFASALERLYRDEDMRGRLGVMARAKAVLEWSWDEQLRRVQAALDRVALSTSR
jgi:glycosyltransferase involved in cell wall biosynthesis